MNLDDLRAVQSDERGTDSLQPLPDSFYRDVAGYIDGLRAEREREAERADNPFDSDEVRRLTDEIETAEEVIEAVYERRVGKVVKRASLAAAGMSAGDEGLTDEESELFAELVAAIEANRRRVFAAFEGESVDGDGDGDGDGDDDSDGDSDRSTEPETGPEPLDHDGIGAGDVMSPAGGGASDPGEDPDPPDEDPGPADGRQDPDPAATDGIPGAAGERRAPPDDAPVGADGRTTDDAAPGTGAGPEVASGSDDTGAERNGDGGSRPGSATGSGTGVRDGRGTGERSDDPTGSDGRVTLRITRDVGEIFGVDERTYTLGAEDVVTLPEENAKPLIERDAAQKLE